MPESWEIHWEDYYEILQIHPSAESEIVEVAYRKLAQKYHPDTSKNPAAEERMKKINLAREVLRNPEKRKQYDAEWFRRGGIAGKSALPKPKPVVDPQYIRFDDVMPQEIQTSSFVLRNVGGPYNKIWISNPDSWVRVAGYSSLTNSDELPLRVEIEAEGDDWDQSYSETIRVRLDEEEIRVEIRLQTKSTPVRTSATVGTKPTNHTYASRSPVSPKQGMPVLGKWLIGLIIFGLILGIGELFSQSNTATKNISPPTPSPVQTALEIRKQRIDKNLEKYCQESMPTPPIDKYSYNKGPAFTYDYKYVFLDEHVWAIVGRSWMNGFGRIIHSYDDGNSWEIQWEKQQTSLNSMLFLNKYEGIVGIDRDTLIKTSDGGKTWNKLFTLHNMPGVSIWWIESYGAKDGQNITVKSDYHEFITNDGGEIWEDTYYGNYYDARFNRYEGRLRTHDGGETWMVIKNE